MSATLAQSAAQPTADQVARFNTARSQAASGNIQAALDAFSALCREGVAAACENEAKVRAAKSRADRFNAARKLISASRYREAQAEFSSLCREGMAEGCDMERRIQGQSAEIAKVERFAAARKLADSGNHAAALSAFADLCREGMAASCVREQEQRSQTARSSVASSPVKPRNAASPNIAAPSEPVAFNREPRTEPTSDVSDCLSISNKSGYGAFENRCDYRVAYVFCVVDPPKEAWSSAHPCIAGESPKTLGFIGARSADAAHNRGGKFTYWLACRHTLSSKDTVSYDIDIRSVRFNAGVGITGRCLKTVKPAG